MFKPRRIHRREDQKDRLYSALRKLYADGVRICAGRPAGPTEPAALAQPARTTPVRKRNKNNEPLTLEIDGASSAFDPYNHNAR